MAKMYTLDDKLLVGTPEVRIGDKVYPVDDRQKTVKKILDLCKNADSNEDPQAEVFKLAFSPEAFKEIDEMDLSWPAYQRLFELVISAVTGEDPDKARFQAEQ